MSEFLYDMIPIVGIAVCLLLSHWFGYRMGIRESIARFTGKVGSAIPKDTAVQNNYGEVWVTTKKVKIKPEGKDLG